MSYKDDWRFDIGIDTEGKLVVEAAVSALPDKRFRGLSREALIDLRKKINRALQLYPKPSLKEKL